MPNVERLYKLLDIHVLASVISISLLITKFSTYGWGNLNHAYWNSGLLSD
ncbi:hypothetical protein [Flavobacterium piscis]|uniref:Uncharacterized protein n=1 Tax=Flavobacterium piscis TaxID=1114874 RepID=A0ABU1YE18_9FLAO|nr:hypothetical protein [Flavobacterium piscis]MDR7212482.1 hypothetical protein [Flavobacterium piscis]